MEPPFYADLNNACQHLDRSKLKTLGPFAMAVYKVLAHGYTSEMFRYDAIPYGCGFKDDEELGYMCKSFLLLRGALMNKDWIIDWKNKIGKDFIKLQGYTNTTKNLDFALEFSKCHTFYTPDQ